MARTVSEMAYDCINVREYEGYCQSMQYKTSPHA
jgi:hypothetical protein